MLVLSESSPQVAPSASAELAQLFHTLVRNSYRTRDTVIVRKLVQLRKSGAAAASFPMGREYRVFILHGNIVGLGYYWEGEHPLAALTPEEKTAVRELSIKAAQAIATPYIAVDIGQLDDGSWTVIEAGDGQFSGLSQIPPLQLWHNLQRALSGAKG